MPVERELESHLSTNKNENFSARELFKLEKHASGAGAGISFIDK